MNKTIRKRFILRMRPVIFGIMHNSKTKLITQLIKNRKIYMHMNTNHIEAAVFNLQQISAITLLIHC